MKHHLKHGGELAEVLALRSEPGQYRLLRSGRGDLALNNAKLEDGRLSFELQGAAYSFDVLLLADRIVLSDGDDYFEFLRSDGHATAEQSSEGEQLTSRMPGKVLLQLAVPGERVKKGQPLLILEAMKMEHEINAPGDGTVEAYLFEPGQRVMPGDLLLRFRADDDAAT